MRFDPKHPTEHQCLLMLDDSGNDLLRSKLKHMGNVLYTTFRHYGRNLIVAAQTLMHLEGIMVTNTSQFTIWDMNQRQLTKLSHDLATARMKEKELENFIKENTKQPYSFVWIDYTKPFDETFWIGYDKPYQKQST